MSAERKSIFTGSPEAVLPYTTSAPDYLKGLSPQKRWQLRQKEADLQKWPRTADGVKKRTLEDLNVRWGLVPPEEVRILLQEASDELLLPAAFFRQEEFAESLDMFGGRSLIGLYKYAREHPLREGRSTIPFLLDELDIHGTAEDVVTSMKFKSHLDWSRVPFDEIGRLIEMAATELGKPAHQFTQRDFDAYLDLLDGRNLNGLYRYALAHPDNENGKTVPFLLKQAGIGEEVFLKMREMGSVQFFEKASWEEIGDVLRRTAEEMRKPVSMITSRDLIDYGVKFLGGRTLRELRQRMEKDGVTMPDLPVKIGVSVSLEDLIATAKTDRFIIWNRVSPTVTRELLARAAEERGKPVSLLTGDDLKAGFHFLEGRSLGGLHNYFRKQEKSVEANVAPFILEQLGITVTAEDVIEATKRGFVIWWNRIPWKEMGILIEKTAEELGILPEMVGSPEFIQKQEFLGGNSLLGMYWFASKHQDKEAGESTVSFLRRKTGIVDGLRPRRTSRLKYRAQKVDSTFQEVLSSHDSLSTVDGLLPSIHSIARLYANPFLDIEVNEIESEAVVFVLDFIAKGKPISGFSSGLNAHLEHYVNATTKPRYKEKLLSAPVTDDGTKTLGDMLSEKREEEVSEGLGGILGEKFSLLSPLQQELVMKIAVDERTMEEVSEEFGMDVESAQEMYYDALTLLRGELS